MFTLVNIFVAGILTVAGSKLIDFLYRLPDAPLTYPEKIGSPSRLRKIFLFVGLFVCAENFLPGKMPEDFYLTAASFFLLVVTVTDLEQYIVFDKIIFPFAVLGFVAALHLNLPIADRIIASLLGGGIFFLLAVLTKGIGGGDVKLIAALGLWLGTEKLFDAVTTGCVAGGIVALILILSGRKNFGSFFAYAPYFSLTTIFIFLTQ